MTTHLLASTLPVNSFLLIQGLRFDFSEQPIFQLVLYKAKSGILEMVTTILAHTCYT